MTQISENHWKNYEIYENHSSKSFWKSLKSVKNLEIMESGHRVIESSSVGEVGGRGGSL